MDQPSSPNPPAKSWWPRVLLLAVIVAAVTAFFVFEDLRNALSWEMLKARHDELRSAVDANLPAAVAIYCAVYVANTALSLPAATILTLAGGALFGLWLGTLLASFSSTLGAAIAFLLTRYLFADLIQRRWPARLEAINRGVAADGAFYLFTLRLVPLFPFFVVNALMGLTTMRVGTFWWVSQLGMLPATFIYVNAGTELAQITSPRGILSPGVLISLALLGIVPLALRKGLQWWKGEPAA
jgi:uncharacterized membrane protein YdjX (TVP38/TMEM64 family)